MYTFLVLSLADLEIKCEVIALTIGNDECLRPYLGFN